VYFLECFGQNSDYFCTGDRACSLCGRSESVHVIQVNFRLQGLLISESQCNELGILIDRKLIAENAFYNRDQYLYLNFILYEPTRVEKYLILQNDFIGEFSAFGSHCKTKNLRSVKCYNISRAWTSCQSLPFFRDHEYSVFTKTFNKPEMRRTHWGSSCFIQRVCGLRYAYRTYLSPQP